ncbi:hypothetical protein CTRI78_v006969 [Colletotrichum trifolii]|uniref:Uncharacterized protein n=1 Tax=Colletotrichum trifolii TaxID=5466 RepID=A0A4R8RB00_COLTR|nr:hypothetical protein CTRI78_v006969 [Colletotrichum trifolii]
MLASLEIISPTAFGYNIPWQAHLNLARDLMRKRLAYLRENACNLEEDKICSFLWSWFAYLDVLGSLSGGVPGTNSPGSWVLEYTLFSNADSQHEIDCIMGFTTRCVQLLAQVADLARHCDLQRIRPDTLLPQPNWTPTQNSVQLARQLEGELMESMARPSRPCRHVRNVETRDRQEMVLMNEAFHWAGLWEIRSSGSVLLDWQPQPRPPALVYWFDAVPDYGMNFTMPQIIKTWGTPAATSGS